MFPASLTTAGRHMLLAGLAISRVASMGSATSQRVCTSAGEGQWNSPSGGENVTEMQVSTVSISLLEWAGQQIRDNGHKSRFGFWITQGHGLGRNVVWPLQAPKLHLVSFRSFQNCQKGGETC